MELLKRYAFVKPLVLGVFLLISGCATIAPTQATKQRTFFFTQSRELELSPCGCSTNPKGGVKRQKNYFSQTKKTEDWYFAMGPAFSPDPKLYYPNLKNKYKEKAEALVSAFHDLKLQYLGLSANELIWPVSQLKKWEEQSGFVWLSANIVDENNPIPTFKKFSWLDEKEKILITSISDLAPANLKAHTQSIKLLPPDTAIKLLLDQSVPTPSLVIILTNLPKEKALELGESISVPHIFLGPTFHLELQWEQKTMNSFWAGVAPRAQSVLRGTLQLNQGKRGIYFDKEQDRLERRLLQNKGSEENLKEIRMRILSAEDCNLKMISLTSEILNLSWEPVRENSN